MDGGSSIFTLRTEPNLNYKIVKSPYITNHMTNSQSETRFKEPSLSSI